MKIFEKRNKGLQSAGSWKLFVGLGVFWLVMGSIELFDKGFATGVLLDLGLAAGFIVLGLMGRPDPDPEPVDIRDDSDVEPPAAPPVS